ncbi:MAG: DUF2237 family protein [Sandaracinaceae bacterium]
MAADDEPARSAAKSVLGTPLEPCSVDPMTGWRRTGCCETDALDVGRHVVCAQMTEAFLRFTALRGNDLSTPQPDFGFPGLAPGDRWCLCAGRWQEALEAGVAPPVVLQATEASALQVVTLKDLTEHAVDD